MKVKNPKFITSCINPNQLPESNLLEIAFAGRSNVGKSSLINALVGRKNLAHSGNTPGKTRLINYYSIDDEIHFVDLPGYGYAKVSKEEQGLWGKVIENYLNVRPQLYIMMLLVDIRHKPTLEDRQLYEWTKAAGLEFIVVATKADKLSRNERVKALKTIRETLELPDDKKIFPVSASSKQGIPELWEEIDRFIVEEEESGEETVL